MKNLRYFGFVISILASLSCDDGHLRGSVKDSTDGKTYLVVAESNECSEIKVDGKVWIHPIGSSGEIEPGSHVIDCNGEIEFTIPKGVVFKFDYWGP